MTKHGIPNHSFKFVPVTSLRKNVMTERTRIVSALGRFGDFKDDFSRSHLHRLLIELTILHHRCQIAQSGRQSGGQGTGEVVEALEVVGGAEVVGVGEHGLDALSEGFETVPA